MFLFLYPYFIHISVKANNIFSDSHQTARADKIALVCNICFDKEIISKEVILHSMIIRKDGIAHEYVRG